MVRVKLLCNESGSVLILGPRKLEVEIVNALLTEGR
jgi:hypothetical protein